MDNSLELLEESLQYFSKGKVILFLGAGISKIAGCYDWDSIIKELLKDDCIPSHINKDDFIKSNIHNNEKIEFLKRIYIAAEKENKFIGISRKAIIPDPELYLNEYIPLIRSFKLIKPFPIIVTTNFDSCLEDTRELSVDQLYYKIEDFQLSNLNENSIFHIHGYRENFLETLDTKEQYRKFYRDPNFTNFISHIFINYCIIFMGYSFNDDELKDIIYDTRHGSCEIPSYILSPVNELQSIDISLYQEIYKIKFIEYGSVDEFPVIIKSWLNKNFSSISVKNGAIND